MEKMECLFPKKNKIIGIITDSDIRKKFYRIKFNNQKAASIMKRIFIAFHLQKKSKKKILLESNKILLPSFKK